MSASILCVDDDRHLCQIVANALRGEGYSVRTAGDGDQAIFEIEEEPPDLVLLDVMLPRRDGFDVLSEIRELSGASASLPVVLMTGCTPTPLYAERANTLGAVALLTKPVPLETILQVVVDQVGEGKQQAPTSGAPKRGTATTSKVIEGTLDRTPLPAILHHLHGMRATGVLELECGKKKKGIQLRNGYPIAVRSNLVKETLGHMLVRSGRITKGQLSESRRRMNDDGQRQGEILVAMDVLSEEEVGSALRDQSDAKLFQAFDWEEGKFRFERHARLEKANAIGLGRSPANLILHGVRAAFPLKRIDRYMDLHGTRFVQHGESPFYRFQDLNVDQDEESILRQLDGTQQLASFRGENERVRRTVYGLIACGMLELRGKSSAMRPDMRSAAKAVAERAKSRDTKCEDAKDPALAELQSLATQLRAKSYFEMLEVTTDSNADALRIAYERRLLKTHPDRYSNAGQAVQDLASEVYRLITQAYETLSDPKRRTEYELSLKRESRDEKEREKGERALEAQIAFREGELALKTRDYESALMHFGTALQLYPDEGDHHAHYGWALFQCHPDEPTIVKEAIEHVRRGVKLASHREKPYLFLGRLYKAIGSPDIAEKMFMKAARVQPECVEALRELRLIHMRREKSKGFIGRLLRR